MARRITSVCEGASCDDVFVTWFISPSKFYVSRVHDEQTHEDIASTIERLLLSNQLVRPKPRLVVRPPSSDKEAFLLTEYAKTRQCDYELDIGQMVLASSREFCCFLRGIILSQYDDPVLETHYRIKFIDFGLVQWVHSEGIRVMPEGLKNYDHLAIECSLDGIYPIPNLEPKADGWSEAAIKAFVKLTENNAMCKMVVAKSLPNSVNYVDLLVHPEEDGELVSVRDFLVLSNHGQLWRNQNRRRNLSLEQLLNELDLAASPERGPAVHQIEHPEKGTISMVRVSHVEDPTTIYVQPLSVIGDEDQYLKQLERNLAHHGAFLYDEPLARISRGDFVLVIKRGGQPCRGLVEHVVDPEVQVLLVDYGNRIKAKFNEIYNIAPDRFVHPFPTRMAMRVTLDNIGSFNAKSFTEYFENFIAKRTIAVMNVEDVDSETGTTLAVLFNPEDLKCMNNDLVDKKICRAINLDEARFDCCNCQHVQNMPSKLGKFLAKINKN